MGSRSVLFSVLCIAAALAVGCGTDDDSASVSGGGSSGQSGGAAGKSGGPSTAGKAGAGGGTSGSAGANGGEAGTGEGGEAGTGAVIGNDCTPFPTFVHGLIKNSTTDKDVPTPVNGVVFCEDTQDPAAFSDLF